MISDTHGFVHPRIFDVFSGVAHIIHAGDIGGDEVLAALRKLAPVTSVIGNSDGGSGEAIERVEAAGLRFLITHILPRPSAPRDGVLRALDREPADFVIFGHSHLPHDEMIGAVRYFNPGSAGKRRFDYPVSVGIIEAGAAWHVPLDDRSADALRKRMNQLR